MADNITVTPGTGATVRADEVGSTLLQVVKIGLGADGAEDLLLDSGQQLMANSLPVVIASNQSSIGVTPAATEVHLGEVGGSQVMSTFTLSLDTNIYAAGDVLADTQAITSVFRVNDGTGILQSIVLNDKDDQGQALDLVFLNANNSLGTENSAPNITDANADAIIGIIPIASADFVDIGGCRIATLRNIGLPLKAASGTTTLYMGAISRGTGTYTASGITGILGILRD